MLSILSWFNVGAGNGASKSPGSSLHRLAAPHARPSAAIDPLLDEPTLARLRLEMPRGHFAGVEAVLRDFRDPDDRTVLLEGISDWIGRPDWLLGWIKSCPDSAAAHLVTGVHLIAWASQARGTGLGSTVSNEAAEAMHQRLVAADKALKRAAEMDPLDPTPWAFMVRTARGLELDEAETRRRFEFAARLAPQHRAAHSHMLQTLCKKWGGSHEQMFTFAEQASRVAPTGSGVHVLVAEAHFERWLAHHTSPFKMPDPYFQMPLVRDSLKRAAAAAFESAGKWGGLSGSAADGNGDGPEFAPTIDSIRNRNFFAFCFWLAGEREEAAKQFRSIGGWVTQYPWIALGAEPVKAFSRAAAASGIMLAKAA